MAVDKTNGWRAPYKSATFRDMVDKQIGENGLLAAGGNVTNLTETSILVPPFTAVQKGLIYTKDTTTTLTAVPIKTAPFYLTVTSPTPSNTDNLIWSYAYSEEDVTEEDATEEDVTKEYVR